MAFHFFDCVSVPGREWSVFGAELPLHDPWFLMRGFLGFGGRAYFCHVHVKHRLRAK